MTEVLELSSQSSWTTFRNCQRKFYWRFVESLVPKERDAAMGFGTLIHKALASWYKDSSPARVYSLLQNEADRSSDRGRRDSNLAMAMMRAYIDHYHAEEFRVIGVEQLFHGPIVNPETGAFSRTFHLGGRIDGLVLIGNKYWLLEHKTTSKIDAGYLERLWMDTQIVLYKSYMEDQIEKPIEGVLYNIIAKPALRQYEVGKTRKEPEQDADFQERLYAKMMEPGMFHRENLLISDDRVRETKVELWRLTQMMLEARRSKFYSQNTSHCFFFNKQCPYFPLCRSGGSHILKSNLYDLIPPHDELIEEVDEESISKEMNRVADKEIAAPSRRHQEKALDLWQVQDREVHVCREV